MDQTFLGASQYPSTQPPGTTSDRKTADPDAKQDPDAKPGFDYSSAIRPVTIRQIGNATRRNAEANFEIEGRDVYQVSLVAQVLRLDHGAAGCKFLLEDSSGYITAKMWFHYVPATAKHVGNWGVDVSEGQYARVIGTLERFNGRNTLKVKYIRRISDSHEIFRHLLEVMVLKMRLDRLTSAKVGVGVGVGNTNATSNRPVEVEDRPPQAVAPTSVHLHDIPSSPPPRYASNPGSQETSFYASGSQETPTRASQQTPRTPAHTSQKTLTRPAPMSQQTPTRPSQQRPTSSRPVAATIPQPAPAPTYSRSSSLESSVSRRRRPTGGEGSRSPTTASSDSEDSTDYFSVDDDDDDDDAWSHTPPPLSRSPSPASPPSPPITPPPTAKPRFKPEKGRGGGDTPRTGKHSETRRDPLSHLTALERDIYKEIASQTTVAPMYPDPDSDSDSFNVTPGAYAERTKGRGEEWVSWIDIIVAAQRWEPADRRPGNAAFSETLDSLSGQGLIEVDIPDDGDVVGWLKIIA